MILITVLFWKDLIFLVYVKKLGWQKKLTLVGFFFLGGGVSYKLTVRIYWNTYYFEWLLQSVLQKQTIS